MHNFRTQRQLAFDTAEADLNASAVAGLEGLLCCNYGECGRDVVNKEAPIGQRFCAEHLKERNGNQGAGVSMETSTDRQTGAGDNLPATRDLEQRAGSFAVTIADIASLTLSPHKAERASEELITPAAEYQRQVHEVFDPAVNKAFQAHREMTALRAKFLAPGEEAERTGKRFVGEWQMESQRREDQKRREQEAEQLRIQTEQREAEARAAELRAAEAKAAGQTAAATELAQEAAEIRAEPIVPVAIPVNASAGRVAGVAQSKPVYLLDDIEDAIPDIDSFLRWIVQNLDARRHLVRPDRGATNRFIRDMGLKQIPGCKVVLVPQVRRTGNRG